MQAQPASGVTVQQVIVKNNDVKKQDWWISHKNIFVRSDAELDAIEKYNNALPDHDTAHVIPIAFPFEGVVGNPQTAEIIVLSHNPYVREPDLLKTLKNWQEDGTNGKVRMPFGKYHWDVYQKQSDLFEHPEKYPNFPAYNLDRNFTATFDYWKKLINPESMFWEAFGMEGYNVDTQTQEKLEAWIAKHIAFVEMFGYHSKLFDRGVLTNPLFSHTARLRKFMQMIEDGEKLIFVAKDPVGVQQDMVIPKWLKDKSAVCVGRRTPGPGGWPSPDFERNNVVFLKDYRRGEKNQPEDYERAAGFVVPFLRKLIRDKKTEISDFLSKTGNSFDYK